MGVNGNGRRELLASKVGDSETETSWRKSSAQLKHPREPGLNGVRLVISNAHTGLTKAIRRQLRGLFASAAGVRLAALQGPLCSQPAAARPQSSPWHGHGRRGQRGRPGKR